MRTAPTSRARWYVTSVRSKPSTASHASGSNVSLTWGRELTCGSLAKRTVGLAPYGGPMALRWYTIVVDSHDPATLSRWWAETLDYAIVYESDDEVTIVPKHLTTEETEDAETWMQLSQGLVFVPVPDDKTVKN